MRRFIATIALAALLAAPPALAQFTGPSQSGEESSVEAALNARYGSYVTVTGNVYRHLREDYYLFRDDTGEITVEIPQGTFGGQGVSPETSVRIVGEVDRRVFGERYIWAKSLEVID